MSKSEKTPYSIWSGSFNILGVEVKCHTLSDGQRIIEEASFNSLLNALADNDDMNKIDPDAMQAFARWREAQDV
jgi:hypothetical protein